MTLFDAMKIAAEGLETWRAKPHNAKWWRRIDGTPIPNDLPIVIAEAFVNAIAPCDAEIAALREELSIWKSVFPDIAPESVLPNRSKLETEIAMLRAALGKAKGAMTGAAYTLRNIPVDNPRTVDAWKDAVELEHALAAINQANGDTP